jgi:GMP reductase
MSSLITDKNVIFAGICAFLIQFSLTATFHLFEHFDNFVNNGGLQRRIYKGFFQDNDEDEHDDEEHDDEEDDNDEDDDEDDEDNDNNNDDTNSNTDSNEYTYETSVYDDDSDITTIEDEYVKVKSNTKLDFSDVLIVPKESDLSSRKDVNLKRTFYFSNSKRTWTGIPIIVANMDTTGTIDMARECQKHQILTCLHKFYSAEDIPEDLDRNYYMVSTGTRPEDIENCDDIIAKRKPYFVCIDVANGYCNTVLNIISRFHLLYPEITLVAGNVVTYEMVKQYYEHGVDIVKMGIGSGSVCTTRLQTGVGYPQFSCILDTKKRIHKNKNIYIISDGGIQTIGDFSKAFGAGADFVMCGGMFSGHSECAGEIIEIDGVSYKTFYGMSSTVAMDKRYGGVANYKVAEGKSVKIQYKGPVANTIVNILGGIRSTMTYIGAKYMDEIYENTEFIRVNNIVNQIYK